MKVLMVCLGNICRSPLAEGILRKKAELAGLYWQIDSAGTKAYMPGCAPHEHSQKAARINGIDIHAQKCRNFTKDDIDDFDKIYVMDRNNYEEVKRISENRWDKNKVDFLLNSLYPGQNKEVPDPWYGGEDGFYTVYLLIEKACDAIINSYVTKEAKRSELRVNTSKK